ncbi:MAG: hypothetical protein ACREOB_03550, partial [Thermodesulfobacteriota bacterium]
AVPLIRSLRVALRQAQGRLHDEAISRQDSSQAPSQEFIPATEFTLGLSNVLRTSSEPRRRARNDKWVIFDRPACHFDRREKSYPSRSGQNKEKIPRSPHSLGMTKREILVSRYREIWLDSSQGPSHSFATGFGITKKERMPGMRDWKVPPIG